LYRSRKINIVFVNYKNEFFAHFVGLRKSKSQRVRLEHICNVYESTQ